MSLDPGAVRHCDAPATFRVETGLYDDGEKPVGRLVLLGSWELDEGAVVIRSQLVEGWMSVEPMERTRRAIMTSPLSLLESEGELVATHVWSLETSRGNTYTGASVLIGRTLPLAPEHRDQGLRVDWQVARDLAGHREHRAPAAYQAVIQLGRRS